MIKFILLLIFSVNVFAIDTLGLNYVVYSAGGAVPTRTDVGRTVLSSGVVSNLNYDWGSGVVMSSGRSDGVIIHFTGNIQWPGSNGQKTVTFYDRSDDGFYMSINNTVVINNWQEQGPANFNSSGSITLTSGQVYTIDVWWYENGGGAVVQLDWNIGNGIVVVPSSSLATASSVFIPPLCCGASSSQFTPNSSNTAKLATFQNRTSGDDQVRIEQIGNDNTITINQTGTPNNYAKYYSNGDYNTTTISQSSSSLTATNYSDLSIVGSNNNTSLTQQSTGGTKSAFVNVSNNNNSVTLLQKDAGSHYADITLSGGSKSVDVTQQGSGNHQASITLTGQPVSLGLTQSGSTSQYYSVNFNCATPGGCAAISVQQSQ